MENLPAGCTITGFNPNVIESTQNTIGVFRVESFDDERGEMIRVSANVSDVEYGHTLPVKKGETIGVAVGACVDSILRTIAKWERR